MDPRDVETMYNLGQLHVRHGRPEVAWRLWEQVLAIDPDDSSAKAALAKLNRCWRRTGVRR